MYQLVAFDMDGTLLNHHKQIDKTSVTAIHQAVNQNKTVLLATGRALSELKLYQEELQDIRYAILQSGALIYDLKEQKSLFKQTINQSAVDNIKHYISTRDIMTIAMIDGQVYMQASHFKTIERYHMDQYLDLYQSSVILVDNILDWLSEHSDFEKINLYHPTQTDRDTSYNTLTCPELTILKAEETGIEITDCGVTKGTALQYFCDKLSLPLSQAIAVGDAENDRHMIQIAGLGVAMGNALEDIKAIADIVVNDNDHGGCSQVITEYLLSK